MSERYFHGDAGIAADISNEEVWSPVLDRPAIREDSYAFHLKLFLVLLFLPEGLSVLIGDFRLPFVRILTIFYLCSVVPKRRALGSILLPSDIIVLLAGAWMLVAGIATEGVAVGLKSSGSMAVDFVGAYFIFRKLPNAPDVSVSVAKFAAYLMIVVTGLAMLDPLTGHPFVHDLAGKITGYYRPFDPSTNSFFRHGLVRAMGPLEHSILFGAVCGWFGVLTLCTFGICRFSVLVVLIMTVGIWFSQARGPLVAYMGGLGLTVFYFMTKRFAWRNRLIAGLIVGCLLVVLVGSRNPVATLLQLGGLDPEAGWYREAIWATVGPMVASSPVFGVGLFDEWDWQSNSELVGPTVDALWLKASMMFGIPGSLLIFLTLVSPFCLGPVDKSDNLTKGEQQLSVGLGIVIFVACFLGFTVHMWGIDWILLGVFAGWRANLTESATVRGWAE